MSEEKKIQYLPFHAVNEFMRDDYRITILQEVFNNLEKCTTMQKQIISRSFSKSVQISGFRNSNLAPLAMKVKHSPQLFERSSEFAGTIMESWSNLHPELKAAVHDLLVKNNWNVQPQQVDRSLLPGFQTDWPKEDTFEKIIKQINDAHPDLNESDDNISLMAVWVGNKLPYNLFVEESKSQE